MAERTGNILHDERTGRPLEEPSPPVLELLATRVRARRVEKGWTQEDLARVSGVSVRYVASLERGDANMSLLRLMEVATALEVSLVSLVAGAGPVRDASERLASMTGAARRRAMAIADAPVVVALVGLRGAGKSTVGSRLAVRLGVPFRELDGVIEGRAGLPLTEVFEMHGEAGYRALEREALLQVLAAEGGMVLAVGGSFVTVEENWALLRRSARTVWLRATPELHLSRVRAQGDLRPMTGFGDAQAELARILAARSPSYAQAELTVDTTGSVVGVVDRIVGWVRGTGASGQA
jgi:XRE family aerobic/anaerobic benzoate catabolism transcriptional regulator